MAEPFSAATGALQVAGAGFQLAKTLYSCVRDIRGADTDFENIAEEIELTSKVIQNFGNLLDDEDVSHVASTELQRDAETALSGCQSAFNQLTNVLQSRYTSGGQGKGATWSRLRWPLDKSKTRALQERLER